MTRSHDEQVVAELDAAYQEAVEQNDVETIDRILADDFVLITGNGSTFDKTAIIEQALSGRTVYEHQRSTRRTVRLWGDTAIVTALLEAKGSEDGEPFDYAVWYSDTYVRTSGVWQYVLGQSSMRLPSSESDMSQTGSGALLDVRLYKLHANRRRDFHALASKETIPLAMRHGHEIVAFGQSMLDDDIYYLIRSFPSTEQRQQALDRLYQSQTWRERYDNRVMGDIESYLTAVIPATPELTRALSRENL